MKRTCPGAWPSFRSNTTGRREEEAAGALREEAVAGRGAGEELAAAGISVAASNSASSGAIALLASIRGPLSAGSHVVAGDRVVITDHPWVSIHDMVSARMPAAVHQDDTRS